MCKAGRALLLQPLVTLGGALDEHLLKRRNPLPEINVRVVGHAFLPPRCARRYASSSGPASNSVKRMGFARFGLTLAAPSHGQKYRGKYLGGRSVL